MIPRFVYLVSSGLQYALFKDIKQVLIKGQLYSEGHIKFQPENGLEKSTWKITTGPLCGYEFPESSDPRVRVRDYANSVKNVPICQQCQKMMRELDPTLSKKWAVWVS